MAYLMGVAHLQRKIELTINIRSWNISFPKPPHKKCNKNKYSYCLKFGVSHRFIVNQMHHCSSSFFWMISVPLNWVSKMLIKLFVLMYIISYRSQPQCSIGHERIWNICIYTMFFSFHLLGTLLTYISFRPLNM